MRRGITQIAYFPADDEKSRTAPLRSSPLPYEVHRREFEEHGTKIRAFNEGETTLWRGSSLTALAKYERAKIAERTRRGMMRKAGRDALVVSLRGTRSPGPAHDICPSAGL